MATLMQVAEDKGLPKSIRIDNGSEFNSKVRLDQGAYLNGIELQQKYDLIYSFQNAERAIQKASELIKQPDLKTQWANKLQKLIVVMLRNVNHS